MTDLHARLLAEVNRWDCNDTRCADRKPAERCSRAALAGALRAAIDLHHEGPCENARYDNHPATGWCVGCDPEHEDSCQTNPWPCPTIRTIARELGVTP